MDLRKTIKPLLIDVFLEESLVIHALSMILYICWERHLQLSNRRSSEKRRRKNDRWFEVFTKFRFLDEVNNDNTIATSLICNNASSIYLKKKSFFYFLQIANSGFFFVVGNMIFIDISLCNRLLQKCSDVHPSESATYKTEIVLWKEIRCRVLFIKSIIIGTCTCSQIVL